jgi:hypothetical protein
VGPNFDGGIGLAVTQCSSVTGTRLEVVNNVDPGMCLDGSKVVLHDVHASGNLRGIMLVSESAPSDVHIAGATLANNDGVGLGIGGATFAVVEDAVIDDTRSIALPVLVSGVSAGTDVVGDGVCWNASAVAHIRRMTVRGSERNGFLISGPASGILEDIAVSDGRILETNNPAGSHPMTSGATPPIETVSWDIGCIMDSYPMPTADAPPPI